MLRPLGDRVLIRPDKNPEQTDSGLHLVEHYKPETSGEVIALGFARHPLHDVAEDLAGRLDALNRNNSYEFIEEECELVRDAAILLRDLVRKAPSVQVGDTVVFSWQSGQDVYVDGERYLLMYESELIATLESEAA